MMRHLAATVKAKDDTGWGTFEAVASAPTGDRDGEIIAARAFEPLPATVPIHVDHAMNSDGLVATGRPFYDGDLLKLRGSFASTPRAQIIRQLVVEGHLATMSVGFTGATVDRDREGPPLITHAELLEVSFVTVPSNRQALVTAARSYGRSGVVARARQVQIRAVIDLALLDVAELDRIQPKGAGVADARRALRDAEALLAQLKGNAR